LIKSQTKQSFLVCRKEFIARNLWENPRSATSYRKEEAFMIALWILAILWTLLWKGVALWKAARNKQRDWFVVMLIIQTLGRSSSMIKRVNY